MDDIVEYITALVDGFEEALTEETIKELYSDYLEFLECYNRHLNEMIESSDIKYKTYRRPVSLEYYKNHYLRATIVYKLMDSKLQYCFEDLTYKDIVKIIGNGITKSDIAKIEQHVYRLLSRHEYKTKFNNIQELIYVLNE